MKKILSLILALVMVIGLVPVRVSATEGTDTTETAAPKHIVDTDRLYNPIVINKGQLAASYDGSIIDSDIYGCVVNYPLKKGHILSISDTNYVFSVRKWENGNYSTMLKQATTEKFTATEDMTVAMLIRKPDKSAVTAEELANIVIYDSQFGMIGVAGSVKRFTVEAETIDGGTATTRAAIFLPEGYSDSGKPTRLIVMTNGHSAHLTNSVWNKNSAENVQVIQNYLNADYAVWVVDNTAASTSQTPDLGCPQLVDSYFKAYEYIQNNLNVEQKFSVHARSFGTFAAVRIMREHPELVKYAVMTGSRVSIKAEWPGIKKAHVANRFGFTDTTGATYEVDKLVGYDPYTDVNDATYALPPTFWMLAEGDSTEKPSAFIEKLTTHGNDVTLKIYSDISHTGICTLNTSETFSDALSYLGKYQVEVHSHSYSAASTAPTCTEQGYTTYTCTVCGDSYVSDYVDATGHTYENGVCTVCDEEHPNLANFEGKVISILGDSISTFAGYIPVADGFNLEHLARYPQDNLLTDVNETWWMQVITALGGKLGINDSWRGATVSGAVPVTTGTTGENAAMSNLTRIQNLGANGTPDVILFYGGTNDLAHVSKVGSFDPNTAPTAVDLTTKKWDNLAEAYVHTLLRLKHFYPDAQIVCLLPTYTTSYYSNAKLAQANEVLAQICKHYGVAYTDLRECGITIGDLPDGIHPDAAGMDFITGATVETLLDECEMEAGENVVHSVTHTLTGAKSSLSYYKGVTHGKPFVTAITGEEVTVSITMGGVDITDNVYADGVITIVEVTGDVVITAQGHVKAIYEDHLQQLPDEVCAGINLWNVLEHDPEYYTVSGWDVHTSGKVYSVTFPVSAGDRIYATSFGAAGSNGQASVNGIRTTFFDADGLLISMSPEKVYDEFAVNGFLTVPEGAVAVNVPMWRVSDENELYILNREHTYEDGVCTACGAMIADMTAMEVSFDAEILMWTYFVIPDELLNDDGAKVLVTKNGAWGETTTEITMAELRANGPTSYGDYKVEQGIASGEMTREVTVRIVDGNGNYVSIRDYVSGNVDTKVVCTAADYAARVFEVGSARQKELVKAMLTYGGYSQKHFNVDAGNPVYNLLTEYGYEIPTLEDITADDIAQEMSKSAVSNGVTYSAQEAYLDSAIYQRVYFKLDAGEEISNFKFEIELIDVYGNLYTETVTATYDSVYDEYYVDIPDIAAAHLDHLYTVTVTNLTTGDTYEVTTSVLVWAKTVIARSSNVNQVNLAKAVYYYNQAANVFFGK